MRLRRPGKGLVCRHRAASKRYSRSGAPRRRARRSRGKPSSAAHAGRRKAAVRSRSSQIPATPRVRTCMPPAVRCDGQLGYDLALHAMKRRAADHSAVHHDTGWLVAIGGNNWSDPAPDATGSVSAVMLETVATLLRFAGARNLGDSIPQPGDTIQNAVNSLADALGVPHITINVANEDRLKRALQREMVTARSGQRDALWSMARAIGQAREFVYLESPAFARTARPAGAPKPHEIDLVEILRARLQANPATQGHDLRASRAGLRRGNGQLGARGAPANESRRSKRSPRRIGSAWPPFIRSASGPPHLDSQHGRHRRRRMGARRLEPLQTPRHDIRRRRGRREHRSRDERARHVRRHRAFQAGADGEQARRGDSGRSRSQLILVDAACRAGKRLPCRRRTPHRGRNGPLLARVGRARRTTRSYPRAMPLRIRMEWMRTGVDSWPCSGRCSSRPEAGGVAQRWCWPATERARRIRLVWAAQVCAPNSPACQRTG